MTMNSFKEIGGYFELETQIKQEFYPNAIALNCARSCLKYIIRAYKIKEINVPYYTCDVVWDAIKEESCQIKFYHINEAFLPTKEFDKDDFILYTNYFGVCASNVKALSKKYPNLIVDNAQAFYMQKYGLASFNSPRKFFGVPDGGYLFCEKKLNEELEKDISINRISHLIKRIDMGPEEGYADFQVNDASLKGEPVKIMSSFTNRILSSIDYDKVKKTRLKNFNYLHRKLKKTNKLQFSLSSNDVPMVYPYLIKREGLREKLIKNRIFVAKYWPNIKVQEYEEELKEYLLPLPIDQRYNIEDMTRILEVING